MRERRPPRFRLAWTSLAQWRSWAAPWVLALAYLTAALWYSFATPPLEAGDEMQHFFAVRQIANGQGLPVLDPADRRPDSPSQEAGQPPLYHLLAGRLIAGLDTDDILTLTPNPHAFIGIPTTDPTNKNRVVHPPSEQQLQGVQALNRARLLSIGFGLIAVLATYLLARAVAPAEPGIALLAGALVAFNPMFLFVSASVANDSAIAAWCGLALLLVLHSANGRLAWWRTIALGAAAGAAALTKLSGLGLLPLVFAPLVFAAWPRRAWYELARHALVIFVVAASVAGWWYVRNQWLYGDATGLSAWIALVGQRSQPIDLEEIKGLWIAFWGVFGPFDILAEPWVYSSYAALCLASLVGWLVIAFGRGHGQSVRWVGVALLAGWFGIEAVALGRWMTLNMASSGRLLFPAIAAIAVLLSLGLLLPLRPLLRTSAASAGSVVLALIAALIPLQSILPSFGPNPGASETDLQAAAGHPNVVFGNLVELVGATVAPITPAGQPVQVELFWRLRQETFENYSVGVHLIGRDGTRLGQLDAFAGAGRYPTSFWRPGELIKDSFRVGIAGRPETPTGARVMVSMYKLGAESGLTAADPTGKPVFPIQIGTTELAPQTRCDDGIADGLFDGSLALVSTSPRPETLRQGDTLSLSLAWCATAHLATDYTVFLHLGHVGRPPVAQHDAPPRNGVYPTSAWARGELVQDAHALAIPPNTAPASYRLLVGLYDPRTGARMRTASGKDSLDLGPLAVELPRRPTISVS